MHHVNRMVGVSGLWRTHLCPLESPEVLVWSSTFERSFDGVRWWASLLFSRWRKETASVCECLTQRTAGTQSIGTTIVLCHVDTIINALVLPYRSSAPWLVSFFVDMSCLPLFQDHLFLGHIAVGPRGASSFIYFMPIYCFSSMIWAFLNFDPFYCLLHKLHNYAEVHNWLN